MTREAQHSALPALRTVLARGHLRLLVIAMLAVAATLTVSGVVLLRDYARSNLQLSASTLHYAVEPAVYFNDPEALRDAVTSVVKPGDLRQVQVFDASGARMLNWQPGGEERYSFSIALVSHLLVPEDVDVPIISGDGELLGSVRVAANPARLLHYSVAASLVGLLTIGLAFMATKLLTRKLQEEVVAPIEHVANVAEAVRHQRNFSLRIAPSPIAEINTFANDFNALLMELQDWHETFVAENRSLAHLAEHDALTGLGNRLLFDQELRVAMEMADSAQRAFTLLFVDFNGFKQINDTHGHLAGDAMLAEFGRRLRDSLRAQDQAFRVGGDEFAILLDPMIRLPSTMPVVDRLKEALIDPVILPDGSMLHISISIGISTYPRDAKSADGLVSHADRQMYLQKRGDKVNADQR